MPKTNHPRKLFTRLRLELALLDMGQEQLASALDRSPAYISLRFRGRGSWTMAEAYTVTQLINLARGGKALSLIELFPMADVIGGEARGRAI